MGVFGTKTSGVKFGKKIRPNESNKVLLRWVIVVGNTKT